MKKGFFLFFLILAVSCSNPLQEQPTPEPEISKPKEQGEVIEKTIINPAISIILQPHTIAILYQNNSFAIDFFKAVSQQHDNNLFLSPFSLSAVLGMLYNGAAGTTQEEIAKVLRMSDYTPDEVNQYYLKLTKALLEVDPNTSLSLANAIWSNKGVTLKNPFVVLNQDYYDAEVSTLDFSLPSALNTINDWCNDKTKGTIPKILEEIDPSTLVILANAIYFKSFWVNDFDKTKTVDKPFHNIDGTTSIVPMMHLRELELKYAQMNRCGMVSLPYANTAFAMNLILPLQGEDIDDLIEDLDATAWQMMTATSTKTKVTLSMPRFKIENTLEDLRSILVDMGMPSAFLESADFSNMLNINAFISRVIQKSYISVDEDGTEAAAVTLANTVTSIVPGPSPKEVTMVLDRPFIFAITEQSTGIILFMGKVVKL